ncbi:ABC transporter permease [Candidatus Dependentiae bacterium]|nr:ABC transporter permease [Candidatus Dependentiae bacterium]
MKWHRIYALWRRNLTLTYGGGIDPLVDLFYWPLYDIFLWGLTAVAFKSVAPLNVSNVWLIALALWPVCYRANLDMSLSLLSELWSRNVVNLFATPLEIHEWVASSMLLGLFDATVSFLYASLVIYLLYGFNVFSLGWILLPLALLLMLSGWTIGLFTASWLLYSGQKLQKLVWVFGWFFVPFSALFYPLQTLPSWAFYIAKAVPMSYVFDALRTFVNQGSLPMVNLYISFALNCFYLTLSYQFFKKMYHASRVKGLSRLESE